jgi:hypothetical protein
MLTMHAKYLAPLAAVLAVAACAPAQPATPGGPASATTAAATPAPTPPGGQLAYLWLPQAPTGMAIQASASRADGTSFVLQFLDKRQGSFLMVAGGAAVQRPNAPPTRTVTVRGQAGSAYTTGEGYTVLWQEDGHPYEVSALMGLQTVLDTAAQLEVLDLRTWQQRVAAA